MMHDMQRLFSVLCLSVAASVATTWALDTPPPLVSLDVKSTLDQYHKTLLASSLPVDEQTEKLAEFANVMNEEVAKYAKAHGQVVLVSAAVVEGTPDITPYIQQAIVERYQP